MKALHLSSLLLSFALAACGGDDGISAVVDATRVDAPPPPCTISTPNFGDKGVLKATAYFSQNETNQDLYKISFTAALEPTEPQDIFFFEVFTGYEPFGTEEKPTPAVAGTYPMTGNQLQYEDCSVCLTLGTNADETGYEDDFMVTGGTVNITQIGVAVGQMLDVTFTDLTFEHVFISSAHSEPVGNDCVTAISNASFTGVLEVPPKEKARAPGAPALPRKAPARHGR